MRGTYLKFYVHENRRHHGKLVFEWLLSEARGLGIHGGSAFRAIAGFGRHGVIVEQHFFELADELPVEVAFMVSDEQAERFIGRLEAERDLSLFYIRMSAEYGVLNGITMDPDSKAID
jgi:PII-like signaling protein